MPTLCVWHELCQASIISDIQVQFAATHACRKPVKTALTMQAIGSAALPVTVMGITKEGLCQEGIFQFTGTSFNDASYEGQSVPKMADHLTKRLQQVWISVSWLKELLCLYTCHGCCRLTSVCELALEVLLDMTASVHMMSIYCMVAIGTLYCCVWKGYFCYVALFKNKLAHKCLLHLQPNRRMC